MTVQRILGFLLIGLQAASLGYLSKTLAFPLTVAAVALFGVFSKKRFQWNRQQKFWLIAALAVLFYAKYTVAPHEIRLDAIFIRSHLALVVGQFLMVLEAAQFFVRQGEDRLPLWLPGLGAVALVCVLDLRVMRTERLVTHILVIGFTSVAALYFGSSRTPLPNVSRRGRLSRAVASAVVLAVVAVTAWLSASGLYRYERQIEGWIAEFVPTLLRSRSLIGFSRQARLGSIVQRQSSASNRIALRVYAEQLPGYLRGQAFDRFDHWEWHVAGPQKPVFPMNRLPRGIQRPPNGQNLFAVDRASAFQWRTLEIWPHATLDSAMFTPLRTTHLQAAATKVQVNVHRIVDSDELIAGFPYTAYVPKDNSQEIPPRPLSATRRKQLTEDLTDGNFRVRKLAERIFAGCQSTGEKIAAVQDYFRSHYQYYLGVTVPDGVEDPLTWFLLEKPAAHCEYFASGTVALLRLGDVPCRYVTGFVAAEENRYGHYWVARNKDAHAWAEAYDERRGWVIVESTPAAGQPTPSVTSSARQLWEDLLGGVTIFRTRVAQGGLKWIGWKMLDLLVSLPGLLIVTSVIAVRLVMRWRALRSRPRARRDPVLRKLHRLLHRMDSRLRKHDLQRRPGETLNQFADRILADRHDDEGCRAAAEWYALYASLRYGGEVDRQAFDRLAQAMRRS